MNKKPKVKLKKETVKVLAGRELQQIVGGTASFTCVSGWPPDPGSGNASWECHNCSS